MSELAPLIEDLALILFSAGVMTLLFKKLKQPLVLGYIVAGFLASPHLSYTPSVVDIENVHLWADIGVIFLLFALGLEFSFKKIVNFFFSVRIIQAHPNRTCFNSPQRFMGQNCTMNPSAYTYSGFISAGRLIPFVLQ